MTDSTIDAEAELLQLFGERLQLARELVRAGSVREVRLLQSGRVVTGIVAGPVVHRIYIQRPHSPRFTALEGECSCRGNFCEHVAAVSLAAADAASRSEPSPGRRSDARAAQVGGVGASLQQAVYYLFELLRDTISGAAELQVSVWVGQARDGSGRAIENIQPFAARASHGGDEYPRYVAADDRVILKSLSALRAASPWRLAGAAGAAILHQATATGRAYCRRFADAPLRGSRTRRIDFVWELLANGDQQLRPQVPSSVHVLLGLEGAIYIDESANAFGAVESTCPLELLRTYVLRPPVTPTQVAVLNEQIAREANAVVVPKPRTVTIRAQALSSLAPKLVLSGGPTATLHFIYNGLDVDSRLLGADDAAARCASTEPAGDVCWEIVRDRAAEQGFVHQLDALLNDTTQRSEGWLAFMMKRVPELIAQGWSIAVDASFPYRIAVADRWYADLGAAERDAWFDLRLGATVDGEPINLLPALVSYLQGIVASGEVSYTRVDGHLLIRLRDGRYLPFPLERIERIAHTLVELHERGSLNKAQALSLPVAQSSRIAQLAGDLDATQIETHDIGIAGLIDELRNLSGIEPIDAPADFRAALRSYQREGLGWLDFLYRCRLGGVLADDMGLGKTVQTLALLARHKAEGCAVGPSLIVAPVSVIGNWRQEAQRFAPELRVVTFHGPRRKELLPALGKADVVITGYSLLQVDGELLLDREFYYVILDEAQTIKNPRAKVSQVARALRARHRLCLTGTPMENHLGELWSLFEFLQPGLLGDEREFQRRYRTPIEKDGNTKRAAALARRIAPFVLRRTKEAVAPELPPKTQIVESLVLEDAQRDFYDGVRLAMHQRVSEVIQQQGLARSHITVLDALLKLRQACCDPRLVRDDTETRQLPSAKLDWLRTVLPELVAEGRRVLLFSQFTSMLRLIEAAVRELAIPYCLLTGETQQRAEVVARFQSGEVPLFLVSLKAGGVGLNLTAADTVIHYDPWWNPAAEMQATDRAYRIGQDKPVFVYKLIAQGTVEEKIMQLQAEKTALVSQLYTDQSATPSQWSVSDIEALFAP